MEDVDACLRRLDGVGATEEDVDVDVVEEPLRLGETRRFLAEDDMFQSVRKF